MEVDTMTAVVYKHNEWKKLQWALSYRRHIQLLIPRKLVVGRYQRDEE